MTASSAGLKPAPVVKPPPVVTAAQVAVPDFALVRKPLVAPVCGAPPAGEPGPLVSGFTEVMLPEKTPAIVDVEGRDDRDVWLLPEREGDQQLLHWDGATLSSDTVSCFTGTGAVLSLARREMFLTGAYNNGEYTEPREARRSAAGVWSCSESDQDTAYLAIGDEMFRLDMWVRPVLSDHALPEPELSPGRSLVSPPTLLGRAVDDVWIAAGRRDVLHWNGVVWEDRSPPLTSVTDLHVAANGAVWIAGNYDSAPNGADKGPDDQDHAKPRGAKVVLRWDPGAYAWVCLPTASSSYTTHVRSVSEDDVWLIGESEIRHWDGKAFQSGPAPIPHVTDAWLSPAGELWLVGWKEDEDSKGKVGVAFRTHRGGKP